MRSTRPFVRLLAPLLVTGLALSACGGSDDEPAEAESSAAAAEPQTWPLTGLDAGGESVEKEHPVYIAKIDNTSSSQPQVGVGEADFVTEELVEGGYTRLAVFYYSKLPSQVGPVRSMRPTDVGIASPVDATIVTSGAAAYTKKVINKAKVPFIEEGAKGISRDDSRTAPYNVMADLDAIGASSKQDAARPDDYFPWGSEADFPGKTPAKSIVANFGSHASEWTFKGGEYVLKNGYMEKKDEFRPATVVAAQVRTSLAPYKDPGGADVPISHFEGKGKAWVFHDGSMVKATWEKAKENSPVSFTLKSGEELTLPPGKVWLELVPAKSGSVTFKK